MLRAGLLALSAAIACASCAVSEDVTTPGYSNAAGGGGGMGGAAGTAGTAGSPGSGGGSATGGSAGGPGTGGSGTGGSGTGGSGTGGSGTGGSGTGGSGGSGGTGGSGTGGSSGGGTCQGAQCQQATDYGAVSGDTGSQSVTVSGSQPQWVKVRVTEDDSGIVGHKLKVTATLDSPPGENFDLYVYVNTSSDVSLECSALAGSSTNAAGVTDTVSKSWGEGTIPNGSDDSRNVSIEVRAAAGATCNSSSTWSLTVKGN